MLEIYGPGSADDVIRHLESDHPITGIAAGNLINALGHEEGETDVLVRVVSIEHIFWRFQNELRHKICVFTEAVENTREARTGDRRGHQT
jgi:hypothetical protein